MRLIFWYLLGYILFIVVWHSSIRLLRGKYGGGLMARRKDAGTLNERSKDAPKIERSKDYCRYCVAAERINSVKLFLSLF